MQTPTIQTPRARQRRDGSGATRPVPGSTGTPGAPGIGPLAALLVAAAVLGPGTAVAASALGPPASPDERGELGRCTIAGPGVAGLDATVDPDGPTRVVMTTTRHAPGARGVMALRFTASPFGVPLGDDGSYHYRVDVEVTRLRARPGTEYVVWAATPELDRHRKLGVLGEEMRVSGQVRWNKFLVFVTAERSADVETWSQDILLSALSPSGRMHTMAGHGPFSGEPCLDPRS